MKKIILLLAVLTLVACDKPPKATETCSTDWAVSDHELYERVLNNCLANVAKGRAGRDYTTNDDEDTDEVVSECIRAAQISVTSVLVKTCVPIKRKS